VVSATACAGAASFRAGETGAFMRRALSSNVAFHARRCQRHASYGSVNGIAMAAQVLTTHRFGM
jgi:hypothetical protein